MKNLVRRYIYNISKRQKGKKIVSQKKDDTLQIEKDEDTCVFRPVEMFDISWKDRYTKLPFVEINSLGAVFTSVSESFRTITQTTTSGGQGLYKCVFPKGISGTLASFNDGSGNLGTIMKDGKIQAQARWIKVKDVSSSVSTTLPINPAMIFMAAALVGIDRKLGSIQKTTGEILDFMKSQKEAEQQGDLLLLQEIVEHYKFNWDKEAYKSSKLIQVQDIKRSAQQNVIFYEKRIRGLLEKKDLIQVDMMVQGALSELMKEFRNYRLAAYLFAFSSFTEAVLLENFDKGFLSSISDQIRTYSQNYQQLLRG